MFSQEELNNLIGLVETGARAVANNSSLEKGGQALLVADALIKKLVEQNKQAPE